MTDRHAAIETIKAEHRAIGDVVHLLQHLLRSIAALHMHPDFALLCAALYYIDDFACRCHHPKEDRHLFPALRSHSSESRTVLNSLQSEHQRDADMLRDLHRLLVLYQAGAPEALHRLNSSLDIYAAMLYDHMRKEEQLLDKIGDAVPDADWRDIAAAFANEADPLHGSQPRQEFGKLRERIAILLPRKTRLGTEGRDDPA